LFDLDEGSNCNDNLGIKLIPRIIMTTNIVLIEKADKRMLILDLMIYDFRFSTTPSNSPLFLWFKQVNQVKFME